MRQAEVITIFYWPGLGRSREVVAVNPSIWHFSYPETPNSELGKALGSAESRRRFLPWRSQMHLGYFSPSGKKGYLGMARGSPHVVR